MVPKGEIVNDEQFLLFAQCFLLYNKNRIFLLQIKYRCLLKLPISTDLDRSQEDIWGDGLCFANVYPYVIVTEEGYFNNAHR